MSTMYLPSGDEDPQYHNGNDPQYDAPPPPPSYPQNYNQNYPQNYGQAQSPVYGTPGYMPQHPNATLVLILGVLGWFVPIVSFVAWYMGNQVVREEKLGHYAVSGSANIGRWLGIIVSILTILAVVFGVIAMVIAMASISTIPTTGPGTGAV